MKKFFSHPTSRSNRTEFIKTHKTQNPSPRKHKNPIPPPLPECLLSGLNPKVFPILSYSCVVLV